MQEVRVQCNWGQWTAVQEMHQLLCAGFVTKACTPDSTQRVSDLILEKRFITFDELENATGLSCGTLHTIIHQDLKMKKICAQWVPHSLTIVQKQKHVETCQQLLQLFSVDLVEFFEHLITVN
ncbi:uncharacterized protein LOC111871627 [Cryptotermes secundus]|uniref:uncharacterized protein LOC111871627 n=1 Tax=Cryptotermes secundus TaxID=105785 RepID=UPI000CD7CC61|nr:uncharacterized protein LOC111871627 [Cryptotermes secundus]